MELKQGTSVRVLVGPYKGIEGVIEDIRPECSAVRIGTKEGNAFALLGTMEVIPPLNAGNASGSMKAIKAPLLRKK